MGGSLGARDVLSQAEVDGLLAMEKHEEGRQVWHYPTPGSSIAIPLASVDGRESFLLDMYRGRIALERGSHQNRARKVVILARLDFGGAPHRNPDGEEIGSPHLHLYRQGYGDKWAYPLPSDHFPKPSDAMQLLQDFMRYCNVTKRPVIQQGIFA